MAGLRCQPQAVVLKGKGVGPTVQTAADARHPMVSHTRSVSRKKTTPAAPVPCCVAHRCSRPSGRSSLQPPRKTAAPACSGLVARQPRRAWQGPGYRSSAHHLSAQQNALDGGNAPMRLPRTPAGRLDTECAGSVFFGLFRAALPSRLSRGLWQGHWDSPSVPLRTTPVARCAVCRNFPTF